MKLTREFARKQAARLQSNPMLAPQSEEGRTELVDCLMRHCQDDEHCVRTMTAFLENVRKIEGAMTAELVTWARETIDYGQPPPGCEHCRIGEDLAGVMQYHTHVTGMRANGTTFATRCSCARGHWYEARDAERKVESPAAKKPAKPLQRVDVRKLAAGDDR